VDGYDTDTDTIDARTDTTKSIIGFALYAAAQINVIIFAWHITTIDVKTLTRSVTCVLHLPKLLYF